MEPGVLDWTGRGMLVGSIRMKRRGFLCWIVQMTGVLAFAGERCAAEEAGAVKAGPPVPIFSTPVPENRKQWQALRASWLKSLAEDCLPGGGRLGAPGAKQIFDAESDGIALRAFEFGGFKGRLKLYVAHAPGLKDPDLVVLNVLDDDGWSEFLATMRPGFEKQFEGIELPKPDPKSFRQHQGMFKSFDWVMAYVAVTGVGPGRLDPVPAGIRDGQMLNAGQTIDSVRVQDARMAVRALRGAAGLPDTALWMQASGRMAGVALYASLFEPRVVRLDLHDLPRTHEKGPFFFRVLRVLDMPQAVTMALERSKVVIYQDGDAGWEYPRDVARKLEWKNKLQVRSPSP